MVGGRKNTTQNLPTNLFGSALRIVFVIGDHFLIWHTCLHTYTQIGVS